MSEPVQIPGRLNLTILLGGIAGLAACLWVASHAPWWGVIPAMIAFSFGGNTMYALMHEAVHRHFHPRPVVNENAGRIIAGFFPTAFSLQRAFHLAHHRNNRTELERFDYYAPGENRLIKAVQWYMILTGLYWIALPLFAVIYFIAADLIRWRHLFGDKGAWFSKQTSAQEFLDALEEVPVWRARTDIAIAAGVQLVLIVALDISLTGWLACYAAFALNWSSLQYTDHAFSELDRTEGAWNLKVNPVTRRIFLNYHYHLAHHRDPSIPWTDLPHHVRPSDPRPTFWQIYRQMWAGPRPLPGDADAGP
ncbi:fatty acid desaturase [Aliiroseovarius subalbicans]|uniref:fatty acid desaturase family protein n=1 Tax=Aliiroseovarius subalbicans TaxID=2925840 RepID=UPI001F55FF78|nr:fatty acid desaturase [Aliiroseovarius subalbicans]MCI2400566.1 fatty acid desaturase [Aliiroseovarius subalbicans]